MPSSKSGSANGWWSILTLFRKEKFYSLYLACPQAPEFGPGVRAMVIIR